MVKIGSRILFYFSFWCLVAGSGCREAEPELALLGGVDFMQTATAFSVFEMQAGQIATQRAASPEVAQFGRHLVIDHTHHNRSLRELGEQKFMVLPDSMGQEQMAFRDHFRKFTGEAFDRVFVLKQIQVHEEAVALYEQASREVPDQAIQKWARDVLPTLRQHLDQARLLRDLIER
jgi:putative membrane protein